MLPSVQQPLISSLIPLEREGVEEDEKWSELSWQPLKSFSPQVEFFFEDLLVTVHPHWRTPWL